MTIHSTIRDRALLEYYAQTADSYDDEHALEPEHRIAWSIAANFLRNLDATTILDVGCGTGRGMESLSEIGVSAIQFGIDPSIELLNVGIARNRLPQTRVAVADGRQLPFANNSFDIALSTAVLHHVERADDIVSEMVRVSRKGVFISDTNSYGSGSLPLRVVKSAVRTVGLQKRFFQLRYRGQSGFYSEGDGYAYPYSVYDTVSQLREHFENVLLIPTRGTDRLHQFPMMSASHLLLAAFHSPMSAGASELIENQIDDFVVPSRDFK